MSLAAILDRPGRGEPHPPRGTAGLVSVSSNSAARADATLGVNPMQSIASRPNVVLIVADDLGFSDAGCYGGELRTPAIDSLADTGVLLTQCYNGSRCSPSRATLMTGLHPHQVGIGILTNDDQPDGYPGSLTPGVPTLPEVLKAAGYATCLAGKWHLASDIRTPNDAWPTRRGFERFFGTLSGAGSYYDPPTLTRGEEPAGEEAREPDFYYTDAVTAEGLRFLRECLDEARPSPERRPFFLYLAYTAPHWPIHAPAAEIAAYEGVFDAGWDALRERRWAGLIDRGMVPESAGPPERDPQVAAWDDVPQRDWQLARMQAYAAQVSHLDHGIGRVLSTIEAGGALNDTLVIFLSDNGASAEELPLVPLERFAQRAEILRLGTRDGRPVRVGNEPGLEPGAEDTYQSYGRAWANLSNAPFRAYKRSLHEGGISAACLISWPAGGIPAGRIVTTPFQLTELFPTVTEATGAAAPPNEGSPPRRGRSLLAALRGGTIPEATLFWEHTGNRAIRRGHWKLVSDYPAAWQLYDMETDRTERIDLAGQHPELARDLADEWRSWADEVGVIPWEVTLGIYRRRGLSDVEAAG